MASDKEYIEKIVRKYERRKRRSALFCLLGMLFAVTAYIAYVELGDKTHQLTNSMSSVLASGEKITNNDIKLMDVDNRVAYVMGFRVGQIVNTCAISAGVSFGYCLYLLLGARKERIIFELYEKAKI